MHHRPCSKFERRDGRMRDIKFRIWCKNNNEWEKDDIAIKPNGFILHLGTPKSMPCMVRSDTHIIQFFTGLPDKNEREIYEDDLCKDEKETVYQVVWVEDHAEWGLKIIKTKWVSCQGLTFPLWQYTKDGICEVEVSGNSHDNPELLEYGEIA